jgi:predicted helicase
VVAPLYLYQEEERQLRTDGAKTRIPNLDKSIVDELSKALELSYVLEKDTSGNTFAPIDILDYMYAILHSPSYRETYKEFLKIDFPRVPYPKETYTFWKLVKLGGELRQLHLLESSVLDRSGITYPVSGDNQVDKVQFKDHKVCINATQYFDGVPQASWEFYIGGYQPA